MTTKTNYQTLIAQINQQVEELASATDEARMGEAMLRYLDAFSRFHRYSLFNTWLILINRPDATHVCGFRQWNSYNRFVKRGEVGIPILAPLWVKQESEEPDENKLALRGFKIVYVFDISQTDGEPLPEPPDWKKPENNLRLNERLEAFAQAHGIETRLMSLNGPQGISKGGVIEIDVTAGSSTRVHELAHEIMKHHGSELPTNIKELEAEATAYVVCRHFGLQSTCSPNYIALHGATSEMIMEHLERIRLTVVDIVQYVEQAEASG